MSYIKLRYLIVLVIFTFVVSSVLAIPPYPKCFNEAHENQLGIRDRWQH